MRRRLTVILLGVGVVALVTVWSVGSGNPKAAPRGERLLGPTPASQPVEFTLVLRQPGHRRLVRFLHDVNDPSSPRYRHYIDATQFGERYGLKRDVLRRVAKGLALRGITVTHSYPQRTTFEAHSTAAALRRVFGVRLNEYRDPKGRKFHAPATRPVIPRAFVSAITGVAGLNTRPVITRFASPTETGFKPADFAKAYGIDKLWNLGLKGRGQTVAIYSSFTFKDSDIRQYDQDAGISGPGVCSATVKTGCVQHVPVNGGTTDTDAEDELDVETVHGMAPEATVLNYEVPIDFSGVSTYHEWSHAFSSAIVTGVNRVVSDGRATIMSISYGGADSSSLTSGGVFTDADLQAGENAFAAAIAHGINVFVATGDQGAYQCQQFNITDHQPCVAWPAESPSVIAVGGTLLDIQSDGSYLEEAGWQDTLSSWGGGGGVSERFPRPPWQKGSVPGVTNRYSNGRRQIPDIAGAASQASGTYVVFGGQAEPVGGTSASSPFWAGYTALVSQLAQQRGSGKLPFLNTVLYRLAGSKQRSVFHDVTRGGNRFYPSTPGWDYATGLGSPDGFRLAQAIVREIAR
jgi:kumamolisin